MTTVNPSTGDSESHSTTPLSRRIYAAVADQKNATPLDLTPLGSVINTAVLDALGDAPNVVTDVSFQYEGYEVHVSDGDIHLASVQD